MLLSNVQPHLTISHRLINDFGDKIGVHAAKQALDAG
jgi:hypothetical protein